MNRNDQGIRRLIRERIEPNTDRPSITVPPLSELQRSEWSDEFESLMRNRLIMGSMRYDRLQVQGRRQYDYAGQAVRRIELFIESGNTEHLVDAANLCLIEFEIGTHPNKHFSSIDDGVHSPEIKED